MSELVQRLKMCGDYEIKRKSVCQGRAGNQYT